MRFNDLTKYQKSRLCKCIFCGKQITEHQEFEFCSTRYKRFNIYTFIHSECMVEASELLKLPDEQISQLIKQRREELEDDGK